MVDITALFFFSISELLRPSRYFLLPSCSAKPFASADLLNSSSHWHVTVYLADISRRTVIAVCLEMLKCRERASSERQSCRRYGTFTCAEDNSFPRAKDFGSNREKISLCYYQAILSHLITKGLCHFSRS